MKTKVLKTNNKFVETEAIWIPINTYRGPLTVAAWYRHLNVKLCGQARFVCAIITL